MSDVRVVVVRNDFEKLAVEMRNNAEKIVADTANAIETAMKASTSPRIARTIKTRRRNGGMTVEITAGDKRSAIHAGLEEYGTVDHAAAPFATPAAEDERYEFEKAFSDLFKGTSHTSLSLGGL